MLSLTIAPCGHAAATSVWRRTTVAGLGHQPAEQPELRRGQRDLGVTRHQRVPGRVEHRASVRRADRPRRTPEQRVQADAQLVEVERLGQVVVAARLEAGDLVVEPVAGGKEEHGGVDPGGPQRQAQVAPVGVGQPDVEHQHVGPAASRRPAAPRPRSRPPRGRGPSPATPARAPSAGRARPRTLRPRAHRGA